MRMELRVFEWRVEGEKGTSRRGRECEYASRVRTEGGKERSRKGD